MIYMGQAMLIGSLIFMACLLYATIKEVEEIEFKQEEK